MHSKMSGLRARLTGSAFALVLAAAVGWAPLVAQAEPREQKVDLSHTSITFLISHGDFTRVPYQFRKVDKVDFTFDPEDVSKSKVSVSIEAASIDSNHFYRDNFTRSEVFLDARKHKDITFVATNIEKTGDNTGKMTGDLTIKDVTKPVTFDVVYNKGGKHLSGKYEIDGFTATGSFKRSDFGIKAFIPWVGDEIEVMMMLEAHR